MLAAWGRASSATRFQKYSHKFKIQIFTVIKKMSYSLHSNTTKFKPSDNNSLLYKVHNKEGYKQGQSQHHSSDIIHLDGRRIYITKTKMKKHDLIPTCRPLRNYSVHTVLSTS